MDELCKAIIDEYNTGGAWVNVRAANTGGLYLHKHKQHQDYPYMVFDRISENYDFYMDGAIKDARVQFTIYTNAVSDLMQIYRLFMVAIDGATLTYGSDTAISCYVMNETGPTQMPDQSWQSTIDVGIKRDME